jgi:large subunit ribosomal protein L1
MGKHGKRYREDLKKVDSAEQYSLNEAMERIKSFSGKKFDQTVELCVHLGIDPRHADQQVRGSVSLPHGTGKTKRVLAFCGPDKAEAAKEAGAVEAGGEDLVEKIENGWMEFDVAVASPDMMRHVGRLGKVLGPRGLMPSPKAGTVTQDVETAVREYSAGKIEFRNDRGGNVHVPIGKQSISAEQLEENAKNFLDMLTKMKPSTAKGQYIRGITVSGTMTPGVRVAA